MTTLAKVFEPVVLGELKLKNRFVVASLTRARSGPTRVPNEANAAYYAQRAEPFGLVLTEASSVCPMGEGWKGSASCYTEAQQAGWAKVCDAVHKEGGLIVLQMWHIGRASHSSFMPAGKKIVSASDVPIPEAAGGVHTAQGDKVAHEAPVPLTLAEIAETVEAFGKAAELAKAAGFDGVEVHMANGYLPDQFLQACSNTRTDEYGGSFENRFRFPRAILDRVLKVFSPGRVGVKLSPNGVFNGMGAEDNLEAFTYYLTELDKYKLAYMQVMDGLGFGFHEKCAAMTLPMIRTVYKGPIMANCGYTPEMAEKAVADGDADCVSFGRPTLANPDYPIRLKNGWPLADMLPMEHWYAGGEANEKNPALGYSDQPKYKA